MLYDFNINNTFYVVYSEIYYVNKIIRCLSMEAIYFKKSEEN